MPNTRLIALNTLSGVFRLFISFLVLFFLTPFIINNIGKQGFGLWSLLISIISFFELLDLGFATASVKFVAEAKALNDRLRGNQVVSTIFFIYLILAFVGMLGVFLLFLFFDHFFVIPLEEKNLAFSLLLLMACRSLLIALPFSVFRGVLFGEQKIYLTNTISLLGSLAYAIMVWWALSHGFGIISLGVCYLIAAIFEHAFYCGFAFLLTQGLRLSYSLIHFSSFPEFFSFSSSQFISNVSSLILFNSDLIIIKFFLPLSMVAVYAIPLRIVTYCYMLIKQFTNVLTPVIANMHALNRNEKIQALFISSSKIVLIPATAITIAGVMFANEILTLWVGKDFEAGSSVLIILLISMWLTMTYLLAGDVLQMCGFHHIFAIYMILLIFAHLGASIGMIRYLGLNGVALGSFAAAIVGFFTELRKVCQIFNIGYARHAAMFFKAFIPPGIAQVAILYLLKQMIVISNFWTLIAVNIIGLMVYCVVLWFASLDAQEKESIKKIVRC